MAEYPYYSNVASLVDQGLDLQNSVGFHGASAETVLLMARTGLLPGLPKASSNPKLGKIGDVYFLPNPESFPFELLPELEDKITSSSGEEALLRTAQLASFRAPSHYLLNKLDLDFIHYGEARRFIEEPDLDDNEEFLSILKSKKLLDKAIRASVEAKMRVGCVMGLRRVALDVYPPTLGDYDDDFRISTGTVGLSYVYLTGIRLMGESEREEFRSLSHSGTG